jgi:hypothetical protein
MADAYKTLYQGQLPSTVGTLVTVGTGKAWIVKHMSFVNTTAGAITFQLFKNGSTGAYAITPAGMTIPANGMVEWDGTMAFAQAEYIAGVAGSATSVSVVIEGDEVS